MKNLRTMVMGLFITYTALQGLGKSNSVNGEYFPFFSWSLFTYVHNEFIDVAAEIVRIGDTVYDPPRNYYEFPERFPYAANRDSAVGKSISRLLYFLQNDEAEYQRRLTTFKANFLSIDEAVEFQLVVLKFNPLERWHTGKVERTVMSRHTTKGRE